MVQVVHRDCVDIFGTFLDALDHYHSLSLYFARCIDLSLSFLGSLLQLTQHSCQGLEGSRRPCRRGAEKKRIHKTK